MEDCAWLWKTTELGLTSRRRFASQDHLAWPEFASGLHCSGATVKSGARFGAGRWQVRNCIRTGKTSKSWQALRKRESRRLRREEGNGSLDCRGPASQWSCRFRKTWNRVPDRWWRSQCESPRHWQTETCDGQGFTEI